MTYTVLPRQALFTSATYDGAASTNARGNPVATVVAPQTDSALPLCAINAQMSPFNAGFVAPVAGGGTGADLGSTTGTGVVYQDGAGGSMTTLLVGAAAAGSVVSSNGAGGLRWSAPGTIIPAAHNHAASNITSGQLVLERGGTESDLSAQGPGILQQATLGAAVTVSSTVRSSGVDLVPLTVKAAVPGYTDLVDTFESGTIGVAPADWTLRYGSANFLIADDGGDKVVQDVEASADALLWDTAGTVASPDFKVKIKDSNNAFCGALVRCNASSDVTAYGLRVRMDLGKLQLQKWVAGSYTLLSEASVTVSTGTWYWLRLQAVGSALKGKLWAASGSEPGTWNIEVTDAAIASGAVGIYREANASSTGSWNDATLIDGVAAGQTANLQNWTDENDVVKASMSPAGVLTATKAALTPTTDITPELVTQIAAMVNTPALKVLGGSAGATELLRITAGGTDGSDNPAANVFIGRLAGGGDVSTVGALNNVAVGNSALYALTTGDYNVALGFRALRNLDTGGGNFAIGRDAGYSLTNGESNIFFGYSAGYYQNGPDNVAIGSNAMYGTTLSTAEDNVCVGIQSGYNLKTGASNNAFFGPFSGDSVTTGAYNVCIGYDVNPSSATANSELNLAGTLFGNIASGSLRVGAATPTARLHLPAGTATASTAPLKIDPGTNLTAAESGAIESDGTHLYWTSSAPTRYQLDQQTPTPTVITVANEAADTTCFPLFATAATGDLGPKSNALFTFNSSTAQLGIKSFSVNAALADADSVIGGDTDANLTYWDASTDRVGIGTNAPLYKLHVNGSGATYLAATGDGGAAFRCQSNDTTDVNAPSYELYWNRTGTKPLWDFYITSGDAFALRRRTGGADHIVLEGTAADNLCVPYKLGVQVETPLTALQVGAGSSEASSLGTLTPWVRIIGSDTRTTNESILRLCRGIYSSQLYGCAAEFKLKSYASGYGSPYLPKTQLTVALKSSGDDTENCDVEALILRDDGTGNLFGGLVVNESGADSDTRIEGDTADKLLICDAGLDAVQIGTTTAAAIADFRATYIELKQDTYWTGAGSGLPYGSCYGNDIAWSQASAAQDTWYVVSDADMTDGSGGLNLVTHDGSGKLTVTNAGRYEIHYAATVGCSITNKLIQTTIAVNGTAQNDGIQHSIALSVANCTVAGCMILSLTASQYIEFAIRTTDAGTPDLSVEHLNITLHQVGG